MAKRVIFVDENDQPIGAGDREEAWTKGYYTRNIRVVLKDQNGRFLSQKRSAKKSTYPGMWTVAASGHVDAGETWDEAAHRETNEEIGISIDLKLVGDFVFKDDTGDKKVRQMVRVYEGVIDGLTKFHLEEDEVEDIKWYEVDELKSLIEQMPEQFTPSLRETIKRFY
jgi:16S rRNA (adenine1518-N6/adenine1519-N6)-dimethyltransferase